MRELFVWNNGKKLFIGRYSDIFIFTFSEVDDGYDTNNYEWIKVSDMGYTYVYSISVNQEGNKMYVGRGYD